MPTLKYQKMINAIELEGRSQIAGCVSKETARETMRYYINKVQMVKSLADYDEELTYSDYLDIEHATTISIRILKGTMVAFNDKYEERRSIYAF